MAIGSQRAVGMTAWRGAVVSGLCLLATVALGQEKEPEAPPPGPAPGAVKPYLSARLRMDYDHRSQGSDKDRDFYGRLFGTARDYANGRLDGYFSGRLHSDLDSTSPSLAEDPFRSVDDSNGVTEDRVLQAHAELHDREKRYALRGGRQYVEIADYLQMDGGQLLLFEERDLGGRVYAGHPVSYYTSVSDDYAGGLSVVGRPWKGNRTRATAARYHDESEDASDDNYYLDVRQQLSESSRAGGQLSILNDEFRMGRADWMYYAPDGETDLTLGGSYWGSFDARTRVYSPLYRVLGEQDPYAQAYARLTQQIVPAWLLSPGVSVRVADQGENAFSNRDYENYDLTLIYAPVRAFNASVALEYWSVEEGDSFLGLSGDVRYRHGRTWEVSGGASFSEYTYDTFSDINYSTVGGETVIDETGTVIEQSPYVYTYFLRGKWRVNRTLRLRLQFDVEDNEETSDLAYRGRGSIEVRY